MTVDQLTEEERALFPFVFARTPEQRKANQMAAVLEAHGLIVTITPIDDEYEISIDLPSEAD